MIHRFRPFILAAALAAVAASVAAVALPIATAGETPARQVSIVVIDGSYQPARIEMKEGERLRLVFLRKEHNPCTRELVIPALGIRRELPPDQPVTVEVAGLKPGTHEFHCGMNMVFGQIVVAPAS